MYKQKSILFFISATLLSILTVSIFLTNFGCAPPALKIDPAVEKARQDSLREVADKAYFREMAIQWSTGYEYHKAKMYRNALRPFWKLTEIDTVLKFKDVWNKITQCYFNLEKPDSAQMAAEMGIKVYPDNIYLLRSVAHIYTGKEMRDEAIEKYEHIVKLDPKSAADWKKLGGLYVKNDDLETAIQAYETVVQLNPKDQETNDILTNLYSKTGNEDAMVESLQKARKQDPDNPKHMFKLGQQYFIRELFAEAAPEFREYAKHNPDDLAALEYLGSSLQNQDKFQEAINVFSQIVKKDPNHKKSLCEIASCFKSLNKFTQARNFANKALKLDNEYGLAHIVRGEIYEAAVDYCMDKRGKTSPAWDDKLVYQLALDQYKKALKDPGFKNMAERKISYVKQMTPTKEDRFMHQGVTKAKTSCYKWIY